MSGYEFIQRPQLTISRSALVDNIAALRAHLPATTLMAPIIKANAYGHGRDIVATAIRDVVDLLVVAEPADALELAPLMPGRVLCVGPAFGETLTELIAAQVRVTVTDRRALAGLTPDARVHLLVDTGLCRLGVSPVEAALVANEIRGTGAALDGLFCHLAGADRGDWDEVEREVEVLRRIPIDGVLRHSGGSSLVVSRPDLAGELVRPGMSVFGLYQLKEQRALLTLRPALTLTAPIVEIRHVRQGTPIGYSGERVARDTAIATLPIGVCHGLGSTWAVGGGWVSIHGQPCALLASPMLDYMLVDITDIDGAAFGDSAIILGGLPSSGGPSIDETAERLGLPREHILAALQNSIPRNLVA